MRRFPLFQTLSAILVAFSPNLWAQETQAAAPAPAATKAGTDHAQFVGSFAVGFLGLQQISIADANGGFQPVTAPVIGARYWLRDDLGIDAGIGFVFAGQSTTVEVGDTSTESDQPQPAAMVLHGGVPLVLADSKHFSFQVVPELNLGFAGNTVNDVSLSGLHIDLGGRIGGELHFGFIGVPQLSLQAGVGVALLYERVSAEDEDADTVARSSRSAFATNVGSDPWDLFTGSVSALYYFDR